MYAFGFGLTIQALFFLSPIVGAVKTCFFTAPIFLPAAAFFRSRYFLPQYFSVHSIFARGIFPFTVFSPAVFFMHTHG